MTVRGARSPAAGAPLAGREEEAMGGDRRAQRRRPGRTGVTRSAEGDPGRAADGVPARRLVSGPSRLLGRDLLELQRSVGNRSVVGMLVPPGRQPDTPRTLGSREVTVARAPKKPGFFRRLWNRVKQVFGYKIGNKAAKKLLQAVFDGRKFKAGRVTLLDEKGIREAWDKIYGKGTYDGTCAGCTEADGPLEGFAYKKRIYINTDAQVIDTVPHEMLHTAEHGAVYKKMGENCNEGFTEYLTQYAVRAFGYSPSSSYPGELSATRALADLVGHAAIEAAYFDGKVAELKRKVDEAKGAGTFDDYVSAMKSETYAAARALVE